MPHFTLALVALAFFFFFFIIIIFFFPSVSEEEDEEEEEEEEDDEEEDDEDDEDDEGDDDDDDDDSRSSLDENEDGEANASPHASIAARRRRNQKRPAPGEAERFLRNRRDAGTVRAGIHGSSSARRGALPMNGRPAVHVHLVPPCGVSRGAPCESGQAPRGYWNADRLMR